MVVKKCINCGKEFSNNFWVLIKQDGTKKYLCDTKFCLRERGGETCLKNYNSVCFYVDKEEKEWKFNNYCALHLRRFGVCKRHEQVAQEQRVMSSEQNQRELSNSDKNGIISGQISLIIGIVVIALVGSTTWYFWLRKKEIK